MSALRRHLLESGGSELRQAEEALSRSELFRAGSQMLIAEAEVASEWMQLDQSKHARNVRAHVRFLKEELERKLEEMVAETELLTALQSRVTRALESSQGALRVTQLCMDERRRSLPDGLKDQVSVQLQREEHTAREVAALLQRVLEQISEQIRLNRSVKYHLEEDLKEKIEAQGIDDYCFSMTVHSVNSLQPSNDNVHKDISQGLDSMAVSPQHWEMISVRNIAKAEQQRKNSTSLQVQVESVLSQAGTDMQKQFKATTEALRLNIQQIKSAKSQMEETLPKMLSEINSQQVISADLQRAVAENQQLLALAESRIAVRRQRPGKERCHDSVHMHLLGEVRQLQARISKLREEVIKSEEQQKALARCLQRLKENVDIKARWLHTDEVVCMQHGEPIVIHDF